MILSEQNLVNELRKAFDYSHKRIWIAVPFIGTWNLVERITGTNWMTKKNIDIKLLTDTRNDHFISRDTYEVFKKRAEIKTIEGLHAKIYIIDDFAFLTSANLTGTAFSMRYEIGVKLTNNQDIVSTFNDWWSRAKFIDEKWIPTQNHKGDRNKESEETNTVGLKKKWKLPPKSVVINEFRNHLQQLNTYIKFTKLYESNTNRVLPNLPIYQEIDSFFNYLFHEHPQKPSKEYLTKDSRLLKDTERLKELKKYFSQYEAWLKKNPSFEDYRYANIKSFQQKLSKTYIDKLQKKEIEEIIDMMHCMNSLALNKARFLNPNNNRTDTIKKEWKELLHNDKRTIVERMQNCKNNLYSFGKSAISEFLAWYYPDKYPIINRNSNSGMRFFGYDIVTY